MENEGARQRANRIERPDKNRPLLACQIGCFVAHLKNSKLACFTSVCVCVCLYSSCIVATNNSTTTQRNILPPPPPLQATQSHLKCIAYYSPTSLDSFGRPDSPSDHQHGYLDKPMQCSNGLLFFSLLYSMIASFRIVGLHRIVSLLVCIVINGAVVVVCLFVCSW